MPPPLCTPTGASPANRLEYQHISHPRHGETPPPILATINTARGVSIYNRGDIYQLLPGVTDRLKRHDFSNERIHRNCELKRKN